MPMKLHPDSNLKDGDLSTNVLSIKRKAVLRANRASFSLMFSHIAREFPDFFSTPLTLLWARNKIVLILPTFSKCHESLTLSVVSVFRM